MIAIDAIKTLSDACFGFWSTEKPGTRATNSEMKRWLVNGSIIINDTKPKPFDEVAEIKEIILFPKSEKRKTSFKF